MCSLENKKDWLWQHYFPLKPAHFFSAPRSLFLSINEESMCMRICMPTRVCVCVCVCACVRVCVRVCARDKLGNWVRPCPPILLALAISTG